MFLARTVGVLAAFLLLGCESGSVRHPGGDEPPVQGSRSLPVSSEVYDADFVQLALASSEFHAIEERIASEWPHLLIDTYNPHTVVDDLFRDGSLIGVYFAIRDEDEVGFASLWYDPTVGALKHTLVGVHLSGGGTDAFLVEVDGVPVALDELPQLDDHDNTSAQKADSAGQSKCLKACKGGVVTRTAWCQKVPHKVAKAACWAVVYASYAGCAGFCYWWY